MANAKARQDSKAATFLVLVVMRYDPSAFICFASRWGTEQECILVWLEATLRMS